MRRFFSSSLTIKVNGELSVGDVTESETELPDVAPLVVVVLLSSGLWVRRLLVTVAKICRKKTSEMIESQKRRK